MPGSYYMNGSGSRTYNTPNPMNFNYPKISGINGGQYTTYPKFKERGARRPQKDQGNKESSPDTQNLTKELEKQIKELQNLTKEAKELAKKVNFTVNI